jgi:succinate dehydrogenase / fumarate reductase membrane anchor subunit
MKRAASTAMGQVLGTGSVHHGTHHWWMQRVTAVALALLSIWFVVSLLLLPDLSWDSVHDWLAHPFSALLTALLALTACWHSQMGVQVVIEDYVHGATSKTLTLLLSTFAHVLIAGAALLAVLRIALAVSH